METSFLENSSFMFEGFPMKDSPLKLSFWQFSCVIKNSRTNKLTAAGKCHLYSLEVQRKSLAFPFDLGYVAASYVKISGFGKFPARNRFINSKLATS